jgi:hypothetical protein
MQGQINSPITWESTFLCLISSPFFSPCWHDELKSRKKRRHGGWALAGTPFSLRGNELNLGQAAPRAPSWLALQWCSLPWVWSSKNRNEEAAHRRNMIGRGWLLTIPLKGGNLVHSTAENKWVIHDFSILRIEHVSKKTDAFRRDLHIRSLQSTIRATVQKVKFWSTSEPLTVQT